MSTTATRERPILFRPELVRKILSGSKTQTRRPVTARNSTVLGYPGGKLWKDLRFDYDDGVWNRVRVDGPNSTMFGCGDNCQYLHVPARQDCDGVDDMVAYRVRPTMLPGDVLWVRETWGPCEGGYCYKADENSEALPDDGKWHPSIHMPKDACRLRLEITGVRVERVQDISEADAVAEGMERIELTSGTIPGMEPPFNRVHPLTSTYAEAFRQAWDKAYPGSWDRNDWVWAISFEVIR